MNDERLATRGIALDAFELAALSGFAAAVARGPGVERDLLAPLRIAPPEDLKGALAALAARPLPARAPDRTALAAGLAQANSAYGHPRADELSRRLADPATRVVVTGQQPGLLGGPILSLVKAVAAVRFAEALEQAGTPALAVFWMATEDHDWTEMTAVQPWGTEGGAGALVLGEDPSPLCPVGLRTFGEGLTEVLDALRAAMPNPWSVQRFDALAEPYRPSARFGEAFARLLVRLLGERCPLVLDAMLPEVKTAERETLRRLVERRADVERALRGAESRIASAGYEPRVAPQPGAAPLFVLRGSERRRVVWSDDDPTGVPASFALRGGGEREPVEALLEMLEDNPGVVSPGVLARPVVQDAILGTTLQVLGPGELTYMTQVAPLYAILGVEPPFVALRPQALALDASLAAKLAPGGWLEAGRMARVLSPGPGDAAIEELVARGRRGDATGGSPVAVTRASVDQALQALGTIALGVDAQLARPFEKTRETVMRALDAFEGRLVAAEARGDETLLQRLRRVREALRPGGGFQERVTTLLPAAARWGEGWVEDLLHDLDLDARRVTLFLVGESATVARVAEESNAATLATSEVPS